VAWSWRPTAVTNARTSSSLGVRHLADLPQDVLGVFAHGCAGGSLDPSPALTQAGKQGVRHRDGAEDVHFEFATDRIHRQDLQGPRREDSGVIDQEVETVAVHLDVHGLCRPMHGLLVGDIGDGESDATIARAAQLLGLVIGQGRAEDCVAPPVELQGQFAAQPAAGPRDGGRSIGLRLSHRHESLQCARLAGYGPRFGFTESNGQSGSIRVNLRCDTKVETRLFGVQDLPPV
jgi:hypothetical protein